MQAKDHQLKAVEEALSILSSHHCVYIFGPPRIGKSLIALGIAAKSGFKTPLILTKKAAIEGWLQYQPYRVTNYEQIKKLNSKDFDCVILDEAHNFSAYPRMSQRMKDVKAFCKGKPIIFLSGTPVVEGYYKLYSQFSMSSFSPFAGMNSYMFFRQYGIPNQKWIQGRKIEMYDTFRDQELEKVFEPYMTKVTYEDAGFNYRNQDKTILFQDEKLIRLDKEIRKTSFFKDKPLENIPSINQCLHRICGGIYEGDIVSTIKIDWVKNISKGSKTAVMAYFIEEQEWLKKIPNIDVFSATRYCEGVDLSDYDLFILYSFGYSGAKFVQLRDRIVNLNKNHPTQVLIPLIKGGLDEEIYNTVSQKRNFNLKCLSR